MMEATRFEDAESTLPKPRGNRRQGTLAPAATKTARSLT